MRILILLVIIILPLELLSQQVVDTTYNPVILNPVYKEGKGPVIFIDEGHFNLNTRNGRYKPFAKLLEKDGYKVMGYKSEFKKADLLKGKILVISNALNEQAENWVIPNPSAFTKSEIEEIRQWVIEGGNLFLIADHMPMGDASKDLALVFGFEFSNGFVFESQQAKGPIIFKQKEKTLVESIITKGRDSKENVEIIASFTGQAFKIPNDATSILTFSKNYINYLPDTAWIFNDKTPKFNVEGWSQGAFKKYGKGKIIVFGEAAMFSAQLSGPYLYKAGMNSELAPNNYQLLLNIIHWLDGKLE